MDNDFKKRKICYLVMANAFNFRKDIELLNEIDLLESVDDFAEILSCNVSDLKFRIVGAFRRKYLIVYDSSLKEGDYFYAVKCFRKKGKKRVTYQYKYIYGNVFIFHVSYNLEEDCYRISDIDDEDRNTIGLSRDFQFYKWAVRDCLNFSDGIFKTPLFTDDMKINIGGELYDQDISF